MKRYSRIGNEVDAEQWFPLPLPGGFADERADIVVRLFDGYDVATGQPVRAARYYFQPGFGKLPIRPGDWIVYDLSTQSWDVYSPEDFASVFVPLSGEEER